MDRLPWNAIYIDPTFGILRILTASSAATITPDMSLGCSVTLLSAATAIPSGTFTPTISVTWATYRSETEDSAALTELPLPCDALWAAREVSQGSGGHPALQSGHVRWLAGLAAGPPQQD